jgi:hypothetical protein
MRCTMQADALFELRPTGLPVPAGRPAASVQ